MAKIIKKSKIFTIFQYDKEEEFLREEHNKGNEFVSIALLSNFTFKKVKPADYVYKLEFQREGEEDKDMVRLMEDYGWEFIGNFFEFNYFRKPASYDESDEIYTDIEGTKENLRRIFRTRMLGIIIPLGVLYLGISLSSIVRKISSGDLDGILINIIIILFYLIIFISSTYDYRRIMNKQKEIQEKNKL